MIEPILPIDLEKTARTISRSDPIGKYDGTRPPAAVADALLASPTQTLEGTGGT
jgi:hypothetical protein